jgi:hypothetical protein
MERVTTTALFPVVPSELALVAKRALERILAAIVILFAVSLPAWSAEVAGTIKTLTGSATVHRGTLALPAGIGQRVHAGDRIVTAPGSYVGIMLRDDTRLTVGPASEMSINQFEFNPSSHAGQLAVSFLKGTARVVTGLIAKVSPELVNFFTPHGTIGVRGTEFVVDLAPE